MKKSLQIVLLVLSFSSISAQTIDAFFEQTNEFLKSNVDANGKIDYLHLKKSPGELVYILDNASKLNTNFDNKDTARAFWINIYNLQVIKGLVDGFPAASVNSIPGFFKERSFTIDGKPITLFQIESQILPQIQKDACIHFVLCMGTNGGAVLMNGAYFPKTVNEQIKQQTKLFINNKNIVKIDTKTKILDLPKIFEWYNSEFVTYFGNEIDFLNIFLDKKLENNLVIRTYAFDWSINKKV